MGEVIEGSLISYLAQVVEGEDLSVNRAEACFELIMAGDAPPLQIAGLLAALQTKGLASAEIVGGVRALRSAMIPVPSADTEILVDTCGTGGGSVTTFNISTAAAIVAAGGGVTIAKHGNRSFTSRSGSADILESLGVTIDLTPQAMARVLAETGIVFMFAPLLHPAMRHVGPVRAALGVRTIMNLLGPLTNPANARRQVVGVADPAIVDLLAEALRELGHKRALVVHGAPGMDEISPCGETSVAELDKGELRLYSISPQELGLDVVHPADLAGGSPDENAEIVRRVLSGLEQGPPRSAVLVNAAAAFFVGGQTSSLREGVRAAVASIDSGAAAAKLEDLVLSTRS